MLSLKALVTFSILASLTLALPAQAENPAHVQRLLKTGVCDRCDLSGANLQGAHLIGADLRQANLRGTNLQDANLEGADLTGANLTGAQLNRAYLTNATLNRSNLTNANFSQATVFHADARGTIQAGINLAGAQMLGTSLSIGGD